MFAIYSSAMKKITIEISDENHMAVLAAQLVAKQGRKAETSVASVVDSVLTRWRTKGGWEGVAGVQPALVCGQAVAVAAPEYVPEVHDPRPVLTPVKDYTKNFLKSK